MFSLLIMCGCCCAKVVDVDVLCKNVVVQKRPFFILRAVFSVPRVVHRDNILDLEYYSTFCLCINPSHPLRRRNFVKGCKIMERRTLFNSCYN